MRLKTRKLLFAFFVFIFVIQPLSASAGYSFDPAFIISDAELLNYNNWTKSDIQNFLESKGSYLKGLFTASAEGLAKSAAEIIYDASQKYQINPKFLLVTLQKEQSLVTDDNPTPKQLDWAVGYGVCDGCYLSDPTVQKHRGFGKQVDNAAGLMRWYYDNKDVSGIVKKKDTPIRIDNQTVTPQSWATAFLYTYTPHLSGNRNFWRIWNAWFSQIYPDGSLLKSDKTKEVWLIQDGKRRKFKSVTALISRADPKMVITVPDIELDNYTAGAAIAFSNYSLLKSPTATYLLDYDTLRPFESVEVIRKIGFNPQEIIDVTEADLAGYAIGNPITADTVAPQGVIYYISALKQPYYLIKDSLAYPILGKEIVTANFSKLKIEKRALKDLQKFELADKSINFNDGTLIKIKESGKKYVIDRGKKRPLADKETFLAMGYKSENTIIISQNLAYTLPEGEPIFLNSNLLSNKNKFLGDNLAQVADYYQPQLPIYLVAEYPSGRILSGKNVDERRPIASLTKLLTAYEALQQNFNLKQTIVYDSKKYGTEGNPLQLITGEKLRGKDIFNAMLVGSVNNAARMVAQNSGLAEKKFLQAVNDRLENWGADNTVITDASGLDAGNKSTARDLLKIFTKVLQEYTIKQTLFQTDYAFREVVTKNKISAHTVKNTNQLIALTNRPYRILASKTGYTDEAKATLVMLIESRKDKKQYIVITMGNEDYKNRFREPNEIARWITTEKIILASE